LGPDEQEKLSDLIIVLSYGAAARLTGLAHGINAQRRLDNRVMDIIEYNIRLLSTQYKVS
jgi:hypothetical protein